MNIEKNLEMYSKNKRFSTTVLQRIGVQTNTNIFVSMPQDFQWPISTKQSPCCSFQLIWFKSCSQTPFFRTAAILDLGNLGVLVYSITNVSIPMVKQGKIDIKFAFVSHLVQKLWSNPFSGGGHIGFGRHLGLRGRWLGRPG